MVKRSSGDTKRIPIREIPVEADRRARRALADTPLEDLVSPEQIEKLKARHVGDESGASVEDPEAATVAETLAQRTIDVARRLTTLRALDEILYDPNAREPSEAAVDQGHGPIDAETMKAARAIGATSRKATFKPRPPRPGPAMEGDPIEGVFTNPTLFDSLDSSVMDSTKEGESISGRPAPHVE